MIKILFPIIFSVIALFASDKSNHTLINLSKEKLSPQLCSSSLKFGSPAFLRIFKEQESIEVWLQNDEKYEILKAYKICAVSGELGPKEREGDKQAPEGIYRITQKSFNPNSKYHLSIDIGYPNRYDTLHHHTGGAIVIHGYCSSIGCFAIDNEAIEELYGLLLAAVQNGQNQIPVHIFPFKLTAEALKKHLGLKEDRDWIIFEKMAQSRGKYQNTAQFKYDEYYDFWSNLIPIYDYFEKNRRVPDVNSGVDGYGIVGE